jgi:virginiamycin B lyase
MLYHATIALLLGALTQGSSPEILVSTSQWVEITEWEVPWEGTRPRDPSVGGPDQIFFVGQQGNYVGLLNPQTNQFRRYDLGEGAGPHNVVVDDAGVPWYAGNRQGHIGRVDPETGEITKYEMPDPEAVRDPHTLVFDENGNIWFTAQFSNYVGRLAPALNGEVGLIEVPTANARPYGIALDSQQQPWFVEFGSNKIGTIDPATMTLTEYELPDADARPRRIALTSDDAIWYVDYARGFLGRMDPVSHEVEEWQNPGGPASRPYAMTVDDRDRLWFFETNPNPNRLVGFDPATESFFSVTELESGGGTVRHMVFDGSTGQIWFGTDTNFVGRAQLRPSE